MIRVRRLLDQDCYYQSIPLGTPYVGPTGSPTPVFKPGNILLLASTGFGPPASELYEFDFGFMKKGDRMMGLLRDKDVLHLSAFGDLTCSDTWRTSTPYVYPSGQYGPVAKNIKVGATTYVNQVSAIAPWGVSATFNFETYVPSYLCTQNYNGMAGKMVLAQNIPETVTIQYSDDGLHGVIYQYDSTSIESSYRRTYLEGGLTYDVPNYAFVTFIASIKAGVKGFYATSAFRVTWDAGGAKVRDPATLKYVYVKDIVPDLTKCGFYEGNLSSKTTKTSKVYCSLEGSNADVMNLDNLFRSSSLIGMAARNFTQTPVDFDWSVLTMDILKQQRHVDTSLLLTLVDLASIGGDLEGWKSILSFVKDTPSRLKSIKTIGHLLSEVKKTAKTAAGADLSYQYGTAPTVRDGQAVVAGMHALARYATTPDRRHARRSSIELGHLDSPIRSDNVMTAEVSRLPRDFLDELQGGIAWLDSWGLYPRASMLYDVIPFSFAVDWFVNFGSIVEKIDANVGAGSIQHFPLHYIIQTSKRKWSPTLSTYMPRYLAGVNGTITYTWYDRTLSREFPAPPLEFDEKGPFRSWAEATALVVQKVL